LEVVAGWHHQRRRGAAPLLLEQGPPEEFFADPRTERAKDFLSKIISH